MTRLAFALLLLAAPAAAQECASAQRILGNAATKWGEQPALSGKIAEDGTRIVVLLNAETATFTVVTIAADGTACLVSAGTGWEPIVKGDPA